MATRVRGEPEGGGVVYLGGESRPKYDSNPDRQAQEESGRLTRLVRSIADQHGLEYFLGFAVEESLFGLGQGI